MHWRLIFVPVIALLFLSAVIPASSQVAESATEGRLPMTLGAGVSDYFIDWGNARTMIGITAWADWRFKHMPGYLRGLGVEIEGHHIAYKVPEEIGKMKQDSGLGGVIYQYRHYDHVQPYAKGLGGFGGISFENKRDPLYTHDTRTIFALGGGADIHVWNKVSIRADYEYQWWRQLFGPHDLNPNGFTIGGVYDFGRRP